MKITTTISSLALASLMLAGCGGDSGASGGNVSVSPTPTPTPTTSTCSLLDRQNWVSAQLNEWYLFPELLPTSLNAASFTNIDDYIDALTATARDQRKDRFFTHITSIKEEDAFFASGSTAGFGVRILYDSSNRLFITDAYEGAPALAAGIDRGTEIIAIGNTPDTMQTVASLYASGGANAVSDALGPTTAGTVRTLRFLPAGATTPITATITKADYDIAPISSRFGTKVLDDGGKKIGYLNMRNFISTSDAALRSSFAEFRRQGISEFVIDLRYNGGGLVSTAELMGDLLGGNRSTSEVFDRTVYRPSKSSSNRTRNFRVESGAVSPLKIAFIGTASTASSSELVMNGFIPYLGANTALVGKNTFGKPVGQIAIDRAACDDRLRVVAFAVQNSTGVGDYYDGLASKFAKTCAASDDFTQQMGNVNEGMTRSAIDFLAGRDCGSAITSATAASERFKDSGREMLLARKPNAAQFEMPGLF